MARRARPTRVAIPRELSGRTLDAACASLFAELDGGRAQSAIVAGRVRLDGRPSVSPSETVRAGQLIELGAATPSPLRASLQIADRAGAPRRPAGKAARKCLYSLIPALRANAGSGDGSAMPATRSDFVGKLLNALPHDHLSGSPVFSVVFEDAHLIIVDKAAGLPTQAARSGGPSLVALVSAARPKTTIGLVHRLDAGASGLVVFGKSHEATRALAESIREHAVVRDYDAVVRWDSPADSGIIDLPLAHDRRRNRARVDPQRGRPARTHWRLILVGQTALVGQAADTAQLRVRLETGRTHQIRIHLASTVGPIVGDRRYGDRQRERGAARLHLHASELAFKHPITGRALHYEAPLPPGFLRPLER